MQHHGAFEEPQHSTLTLIDAQGRDLVLKWTHPTNKHLYEYEQFMICLTSFVCCGFCDPDDPQASDLTPGGVGGEAPHGGYSVPREHGFWVHSPERQRTFYFYAKSREEQQEWVENIRHNLEVLRSRPGADGEIMSKCERTLITHGYTRQDIRRYCLCLMRS